MIIEKEFANDKKVLHWTDFAGYARTEDLSATPQIAAYFRNLLEKYEESDFVRFLVLPSPIALSGFFKCSEFDIVDALKELKRQGYSYEISGDSGPVTIWDPLVGHRELAEEEEFGEVFHWQQFFQNLLASPMRLINQW